MALSTYALNTAQPEETASPQLFTLVTGHHVAEAGYATWRSSGTTDYLLMLTLSGRGRIGWAGGDCQIEAGSLLLLHPHVRHDYGIAPQAERWEILWVHFVPYQHWREWLNWPELALGIGKLEAGADISLTATLREMHRRATGGQARREAWAMNALEEVLLRCDALNPASHSARLDGRIADTARHLRQHFREPFYLPQLAAQVGLSSSRLSHLFAAQMGQTPRQFLEGERLARAAQLLAFTSRPVHAIADEVGYDNPFYFTLRFKARFGLAPRDYRQRQSEPETASPGA